jgi:hypothetical protein
MSSDFAMNVLIVILDVTTTADMAAFLLESLRKHDATPSIRDSKRIFSNRRINGFQIKIDVTRFVCTLLMPGSISSRGNCAPIRTIMSEVF